MVKNPPANAGDTGDAGFPVSGKSPAEEHGNPLQCSCLRISWTEGPSRLWSIDSHACMHLYNFCDIACFCLFVFSLVFFFLFFNIVFLKFQTVL